MPLNQDENSKKKKKGHNPRHQNTFAFVHNPKSKMTAKILASPNINVCRRCHDKIEWRKQYRKYKPRTQPGRCNGCQKKNVRTAYHTICESCTTKSASAKAIIEEKLASIKEKPRFLRACAICVKEVTTPDPEDYDDDEELVLPDGRIRLRERKALERKIMQEGPKKSTFDASATNDESDGVSEGSEEQPTKPFSYIEEGSDDEEDPFLKAVGGADKLVTGEAYHKKLLAQQEQQQIAESGAIGSS
jgi:hypothetical protein